MTETPLALRLMGFEDSTPQEEERRARQQQRHMERMRREGERTRERRESEARRAKRRELRENLDVAERNARDACREYNRVLTVVGNRVNLPDELIRVWDRAYTTAWSACARARAVRKELEAL